MLGALKELTPIIRPVRLSITRTRMGTRSLQIAWKIRQSGKNLSEEDFLISGIPTYGFIERHRALLGGTELLLVDDGVDSTVPQEVCFVKYPVRKGGKLYSKMVNAVAGRWPERVSAPVSLFTSFPQLRETQIEFIDDFTIRRHSFEMLTQHFLDSRPVNTTNSTGKAFTLLIGTDLSMVSDTVTETLVGNLAHEFNVSHYLPHRHEPIDRTVAIANRLRLIVVWPDIPLELRVLMGYPNSKYILMPGALWYTMPQLLRASPMDSYVRVDISSRILAVTGALPSDIAASRIFSGIEDRFSDQR